VGTFYAIDKRAEGNNDNPLDQLSNVEVGRNLGQDVIACFSLFPYPAAI
jgi:hypothetical protein